MSVQPFYSLLGHLRRRVAAPAELSDGQLLERFAARRDEAAFEALLVRHGPLVWGVCRRVLRDAADTEDAFQATFLVLAQKAGAIRRRAALASWLYGVAYRLALKARERARRRVLRESQAAALPRCEPPASDPELRAVLDEELGRLPDKYRAPLVLCYYEGKTNEQAAQALGWPTGSISKRLTRARALLRRRLTRRGVTAPAALTATLLAGTVATAVPASLLRFTCAAALAAAHGQGGAAPAAALARSLLGEMSLARVKAVAAATLLLAFLAAGLTAAHSAWASRTPAADAPKPAGGAVVVAPPRADRHGDPLPPGALARLGTVRWRTTDPTYNSEKGFFSPDGRSFVAWGGRTVEVIDVATGRLRLRPGRGSEELRPLGGATLSPDGQTLLTVSVRPLAADGPTFRIQRWNLATGQELPTGEVRFPPAAALAVGVSPRGQPILTLSTRADAKQRILALFDPDSGKELVRFAGPGWLGRSVTFAPDGQTLAVVTDKNTVRLLDGQSLRELRQLGPTAAPIHKLEFAPGGHSLAALDDKGGVRVWEVATGREVSATPTGAEQFAWSACLALSPDAKRFALGPFRDNSVRVYEVKTGQEVRRFASPNSYISHLTYAPDGRTLAANSGSVILAWDVATGKARHAERDAHFRPVQCLAWSPDGRTVATASGHHLHHVIRLWDADTGHERAAWPVPEPSTVGIYSLVFSPDGRYLVSCEWGKTRLWEVAGGRCLLQWPRATGFDPWAAFADDGRLALVEGQAGGGQAVVLRAIPSGKEVGRVTAPTGWSMISGLAFAPRGGLLALSGQPQQYQGRLLLCDPVSGDEVAPPEDAGHEYAPLFFSPTAGQLWAFLPKRGLSVWHLATRRRHEIPLEMAPNFWAAAFSADGRLCAVAGSGDSGERPTLTLLELAGGGRRWRIPLPMRMFRSLAFSPDGRRLATAHSDSTVLIWDLEAWPVRAPAAQALSADELNRLWDSLAGDDAAAADRALRTLRAHAGQAVPLCKERLRPAARVDARQVARLIADLDSGRFATREKAAQLLGRMGELAAPALLRAHKGKASLETRRRIDRLLVPLSQSVLSGARLREVRGVELLERIGTPEVRPLLEALADGAPEARLTEEARAALRRINRPIKGSPR